MAEIRETFMAGDLKYEIRLGNREWYELWLDGSIIGERNEWPIDPETQQPYVASKFVEVTANMCVALVNGARGAG